MPTLQHYALSSYAATSVIEFSLTSSPNTDPLTFTLTCNSTGSPATTVSWTRDGMALNDSTATASQSDVERDVEHVSESQQPKFD